MWWGVSESMGSMQSAKCQVAHGNGETIVLLLSSTLRKQAISEPGGAWERIAREVSILAQVRPHFLIFGLEQQFYKGCVIRQIPHPAHTQR